MMPATGRAYAACRSFGRIATVATVAVVAFASPVAGQEPWRASYFPYFLGGPTDGFMGVARYQLIKAAPYFVRRGDDEVINPLTFAGAFSAEAGAGTRGSRFLTAKLRGPGLIPGFRIHAVLSARREGRFGFYPEDTRIGSRAELSRAGSVGATSSLADDPNRVRRTRYVARTEFSRQVVGPLYVAVSASIEHTRFNPISTMSVLASPISGTDGILRGTVVVDTRDMELVPANGILAEAGVLIGTDGVDTNSLSTPPRAAYQGGYVHLRGYVSPREGTVVAARFGLRTLSDGAPLSAKYMMPGWEGDITVLGGVESHRGYIAGRFSGQGVLLGGLEVRHDLLNAGDFGAVTMFGFVDGGRVFNDEGARLTTDDWEMGYGGGAALRILRSAIITFNFAGGGDGFTFNTGTGWSF